jgi:hypothetical protein
MIDYEDEYKKEEERMLQRDLNGASYYTAVKLKDQFSKLRCPDHGNKVIIKVDGNEDEDWQLLFRHCCCHKFFTALQTFAKEAGCVVEVVLPYTKQ